MGLRRRDGNHMIWPGFVDAVTTLLMVLMFVLTIFTVMQSVLRDTITTQDTELTSLTSQVAQLAVEAVHRKELDRAVQDLPLALGHTHATACRRRLGGSFLGHVDAVRVCLDAHAIYQRVNDAYHC